MVFKVLELAGLKASVQLVRDLYKGARYGAY